MALGDMSRGLIQASKTKGWDPTQILDGQNISNFDQQPDPWKLGDQSVGKMPGGTPDGWPDGAESTGGSPPGSNGVDWQKPNDASGNTPIRHTKNADPFDGMGEF